MKRLALRSAAILLLAILSCSKSNTTVEFCNEACTIWRDCTGWDFATCTSECRAEGDWDAGYLSCLRSRNCNDLSACD